MAGTLEIGTLNIESTDNLHKAQAIYTGTSDKVVDFNSLVTISYASFFNKPTITAPLFTKVNAYSISIPAGFSCSVNGSAVSVASTYTLSLNVSGVGGLDTGSKTAGTDYYVYALTTGAFIISANNSYPSGYTVNNSRQIGGFHYGVVPEAFTAVNNITSSDATKIAGINAYSCWDLKWRPNNLGNDARGMVYVNGKWFDIYLLNAEHIVNGTSKAGAYIAGGDTSYGRQVPKVPLSFGGNGTTTYGSFTWFEAAEVGQAYGKKMISYQEFGSLAYGVAEATSSNDSDGLIKHIANHTSKWGICQATGHQWIWGADVGGNRDEGSTTWDWRTGLTESRGDIYALHNNHVTAVVLGGAWNHSAYSGSRASSWVYYVWSSNWGSGCRFACDHLLLV